jgi:lipopolysaccharide/colanic/teichoic acid biosynthesis glycosyltransferase
MHTSVSKLQAHPGEIPKKHSRMNVFLFISNDEADLSEYLNYFPKSFTAHSFSEAQQNICAENPPELIIIDIPLNHLQLVGFKVWLTVSQFRKIPIIYNDGGLKKEEIKQLFIQGLVDDVVALQNNYKKLPYKAEFLRKVDLNKHKDIKVKQAKDNFGFAKEIIMRSIDIIISTVALLVSLPLFLLIAIAIKVESKGPVFYNSLRAGKGFKVFRFFKFRTMITDADKIVDELAEMNLYSAGPKQPHFFKVVNDPRITKIGSFLRNTSLDELPQLFNVLKGDMSIVGNRPLPLYEATTLTTNEWAERFMAPAGITGLWQISKRGSEDMSNEERVLLDIDYARHRSLKGDLKILLKTPSALIQKSNV